MKSERSERSEPTSSIARTLVAAGLALGAVAAHAMGGYTVTPAQEQTVKVGQTADQVRQELGKPAHIERFMGEPGPVWTYAVSGGLSPTSLFEVTFGPDGKVATVIETEQQVD